LKLCENTNFQVDSNLLYCVQLRSGDNMETFKILYTLLGGLGIFFYGMKQMSDSLQQAAGDVISRVINSLTTNRFLAVVVGMIVTMIVQSSSVTTVMVVGFVNAGLMNLTQAIGVILGSNIGTTITGWIISIKVGKYGLLFIGLGIFPALFSQSEKLKNFGRVLFGVGMIFLGLQTMSAAFKPLRTNPEFLDMISFFSGQHYMSYLASIITGCLLTVIIQSSSAMLGITIALASTGVINLNTAIALVLGENIGTTITALLASIGTSTNAKRAARAHAFFNLLGVLLIFIFLPYYINFVEYIIPGVADAVDAEGGKPNIAAHIAASHTMFNVTATIVFLPLIGYLARIVTRLTPDQDGKETPHLLLIGDISDVLPATAIVQAKLEAQKMFEIIERQFTLCRSYIAGNEKKSALKKIAHYEQITDNMQKEITVFLSKVMERPMSSDQSKETQAIIKIADELESISDYIERAAIYKTRFDDSKEEMPNQSEYLSFMDEVWKFTLDIKENVFGEEKTPQERIIKESERLSHLANNMRDKHLDRVASGDYGALSSLTYSDMVVALRKIRAHAYNSAMAARGIISETPV
jgi:phosphate:Na+ symporter